MRVYVHVCVCVWPMRKIIPSLQTFLKYEQFEDIQLLIWTWDFKFNVTY